MRPLISVDGSRPMTAVPEDTSTPHQLSPSGAVPANNAVWKTFPPYLIVAGLIVNVLSAFGNISAPPIWPSVLVGLLRLLLCRERIAWRRFNSLMTEPSVDF